jgi:hypothetical protein
VSITHSHGAHHEPGTVRTVLDPTQSAPQGEVGEDSDGDLVEIEGDLARFSRVVEKRYGEAQKDEVLTWVNRRYSHWTGNYVGMGYKDADPKRP